MQILYDLGCKASEKTMNYSKLSDKIIIPNDSFDARATLFSGQVFRVKTLSENKWLIPSLDKAAIIEKGNDETIIFCEDVNYFVNFFDLQNDYSTFLSSISDEYAKNAIFSCPSLKIMKQDRFETIIDFIMSANNNIKRFSKTLDKISKRYGKKCTFLNEEYYSFPSPEILASSDILDLKNFGCGYRDRYIIESSKAIADGFDLDVIEDLDTTNANKYLCNLKGIGEKVADCILLFAFQKYDAFPVDTWIEKVYKENYGGTERNRKKIREFFVDKFGKNAGIIQQYLFFNAREK